ncbi:hypothetical protein [Actinocorallia libanotica]|uniref:Type III secretion system (T3SS) SseB-like protein n=1 Tax=Actinocorallia libanotica TaxID=46162 RepID=A0ABN1RZ40_9ACTN
MTSAHDELRKQQAEITSLLLYHLQEPFTESTHIRGVLPVPPPAEALRVVVGPPIGQDPDSVIAHEIPLRAGEDYLTVEDIVGLLRRLLSTVQIVSSGQVDTVMGVRTIRVDPSTVKPADPSPVDRTLTILRSLTFPYSEKTPDPRLCGFLYRDPNRLRLYLTSEDVPGVTAVDLRPSTPATALLAAAPSLITEEERRTQDDTDPHCSRVVDLTDW